MKKVFSSESQIDAHIMKDALRRESIPVEIRGEALAGALGDLPKWDINPTLWVPDEYYARALAVVAAIEKEQTDSGQVSDWQCGHCGESNEGHFAECWNCQRPHQSED